MRQFCTAIAEVMCSTTGGVGFSVEVVGSGGCQLSTKLNVGSLVALCTFILYACVIGMTTLHQSF